MKRLGLLGGMSWESSVLYEQLINRGVRDRLGGVHSADLLVRSYDFAAIEELQATGEWERAGDLLADDARMLEAAGCEVIGLCTNTMHLLADRIESAVDARFVHLADATAEAVTAADIGSVALLGTRYTMEHDFYAGRLRDHGLRVLVPDEPDRTTVHDVIYGELVQGVVDDGSRRRYLAIIDRLAERGAEGVIAGCTEIELLVGPDDVTLPYFPTTQIHAAALVDAVLAP